MFTLYSDIRPYSIKSIKVDMPHILYVEQCGNPEGIPVVFLHSGPGAGCLPYHRRFFDPDVYRIILVDQRGCGRSSPHSCVEANNTGALIADLEVIRQYLDIEQWMLCGTAWGSTLALAYAQEHPKTVLSMILHGVFLGREDGIKWLFESGANKVFPDSWERFIRPIASLLPEMKATSEQNNNFVCQEPVKVEAILQAYSSRLNGGDDLARMAASKAWSGWVGSCSTLRPSHTVMDQHLEPHVALSLARIQCHYWRNQCFLKPNQILANMSIIKDIPTIVVHGRYDMVCPLESAMTLHKSLPSSELSIIRDAGHSLSEPSGVDALMRATDEMAKILSSGL